MSELKPCPFCGGNCVTVWSDSTFAAWWTECQACGASFNSSTKPTKAIAVAAWNRRDSNSTDTEVERLRADNDALRWLLRQIVNDLPMNRDWLDPALERAAINAAKGE